MEIPNLKKTFKRSFYKTCTWRVVASLDTAFLTWVFSGDVIVGLKVGGIINQGSFLRKMGIDLRAEILSKKMSFLKKTDLYTRIRRLTHKDEMGELFKVMFVTTKDNNFKTGFNDIKI